jgi:hypothetical protein
VRNLLDDAILDATNYEEGSYTARRLHGLERARLFSKVLSDSIRDRPVEARIRYLCNHDVQGRRWNPETCRTLGTFIKASPGTFGTERE